MAHQVLAWLDVLAGVAQAAVAPVGEGREPALEEEVLGHEGHVGHG